MIVLYSKNNENFSIYWKSKEIQHLLTLAAYNDTPQINEKCFYEFLANFLAKSLVEGHLG